MNPKTVQQQMKSTFKELRQTETMKGDTNGNVILRGERFNLMGADYFMADIFELLSETYGKGAGGILKETGDEYGKDLINMLDEKESSDKTFGAFLGLLGFLGYSLPEIEDDAIIFPSSPTAEEHLKKDVDRKQTCYFLTGVLNGAAESLGMEERFIESQCKADGAENCTFTIRDA